MAEQTIKCPNCGIDIPISKTLKEQIELDIRKNYNSDLEKIKQSINSEYEDKLALEKIELEKKVKQESEQLSAKNIKNLNEKVQDLENKKKVLVSEYEEKLKKEKLIIEEKAKKLANENMTIEMEKLKSKIKEQNKELTNLPLEKARLKQRENALTVKQKSIETEVKQRVNSARTEISESIEKEYHDQVQIMQKKLRDAKSVTVKLKQQLEQSSQQTQGEIIELELENLLKQAFPEDKIEPTPNGKIGADIIQKVFTSGNILCGKIIWESKNTINWSNAWLPKLRADQRRNNADLAVLVSKALPKEINHFGLLDNVWISDFSIVLGVATAFRLNLIQITQLKQTSDGKHEKMELLYGYLSSTEFRQRIESIVEAFQSMQEDLSKERQTMEKSWVKRQSQIQLVVQNINGMYFDMQGASNQSLPKIKRLELSAPKIS